LALNNLRNKLNWLIIIAVIGLTALLGLNYLILNNQLEQKDELKQYHNIRLLVNPFLNRIAENFHNLKTETVQTKLEKAQVKQGFKAIVIDLEGHVLFPNSIAKQQISLKNNLHYDIQPKDGAKNMFKVSFPLIINNSQQGSVIFELPKSRLMKTKQDKQIIKLLLPWLATACLIILGLLIIKHKLSNSYFQPLKKLSKAAAQLAKGNYEQELTVSSNKTLEELSSSLDQVRKKLQEIVNQKQAIAKSKNELIASISHDLKTPLATIQASIEGLIDGTVQNEETVQKYYQVIQKKNQATINMIDDLLAQTKKELAQLEITRKEIYSRSFLNSVITPLKLQYESKNTHIKIKKPLPNVLIDIDPEKMEQVIINLVENALKYSRPQVKIAIGAKTTNEVFKLFITDNGYGIPPDDLPHIFDRFYRGAIPETKNISGSGVGLWTCKQIIEAHQGAITVDSELGTGTTFTIILPLN